MAKSEQTITIDDMLQEELYKFLKPVDREKIFKALDTPIEETEELTPVPLDPLIDSFANPFSKDFEA